MTTIAYRNGVMAADSQVTGANVRWGDMAAKMRRTDNGGLVGCSGRLGPIQSIMEWAEQGATGNPPNHSDDLVEGLVVGQDGSMAIISEGHLVPFDAEFTALGSGAKIAMGAMAMGASAREAVGIAASFDVYTGGRITTLALREDNGAPADSGSGAV